MLIDLAVRFLAPVLIVLAGLAIVVVIHIVGGGIGALVSGTIRLVFAVLRGVLVGLIGLGRIAGRGVARLYRRIRV